MTTLWGPLGWMALHSASINYPDNPSQVEKQICSRFLDLFTETISCNICKSHFLRMLQTYKVIHPEYLNSKQDLFLFTVRAHNTVNRRLDKPTVKSVSEALKTLQQATSLTSPAEYRQKYIEYLKRTWGTDRSANGLFASQKIRELEKINNEYWNHRETSYVQFFYEADVLEYITEAGVKKTSAGFAPLVGGQPKVGFGGGRLKLRR
uniref:thiol oxidase n=1 Tax=viral metagenome TaxID=1070528 RepID=A0A6C0HFI6_9ZZZZ